jgi:CHASE3 domain sensor protein
MSILSLFRRNMFAFPLAALAALAMLAISEASYQDATTSLDSLGHRGNARNNLNALLKGLLDAETGQRGYLLTQRPEYLAPYRRGVLDVRNSVNWLVPYYAGDPKTAELMRQVEQATEAKLGEMETTDRAARSRRREQLARPAAFGHRQGEDGPGPGPGRGAPPARRRWRRRPGGRASTRPCC